jgi:hypothetical protein
MSTGANIKTISEFFGWDEKKAKELLGDTVKMAHAELKLYVCQNQLTFMLTSKQPLAKLGMGNVYAGQSQVAPMDGAEAPSSLFSGLQVVTTHRAKDGTTLQEPTYADVERRTH